MDIRVYLPRERIELPRVQDCLRENLLAAKERTASEITIFALGILFSAAFFPLLPLRSRFCCYMNSHFFTITSADNLNRFKNEIGTKAARFLHYLDTCTAQAVGMFFLLKTLEVSFIALSTLNPVAGLYGLAFFAVTGGHLLPIAKEKLFHTLYFSESSQEKENKVTDLLTFATNLSQKEIPAYQDSIIAEKALSALPIESIKILVEQAPQVYTKELLERYYLTPERRKLLHLEEIAEPTSLIESEVLKDWNERVEAVIQEDISNEEKIAALREEKKSLHKEEENVVTDLLAFAKKIQQGQPAQYSVLNLLKKPCPEKIPAYQDFIIAQKILSILSPESIKTLMEKAPHVYEKALIQRAKLSTARQESLQVDADFTPSHRVFSEWNKRLNAVSENAILHEEKRNLLRKEKDLLHKEWRMKYKTIVNTVSPQQRVGCLSNLERLDFQGLEEGFLTFTSNEWETISSALKFPKSANFSLNIQNGFAAYGLYIAQDFLDTKVEVMNPDTNEVELKTLHWLSVQENPFNLRKNLTPFIDAIKALATDSRELPSVAPQIFPYQRTFHHVIKLTSVALWIALNPIPVIAGIAIATFLQFGLNLRVSSLEDFLRTRTLSSDIPNSYEIISIDNRLQVLFAKTVCLSIGFFGASLLPGMLGAIAPGLFAGFFLGSEVKEYTEQLFGSHPPSRENSQSDFTLGEFV